MNQNISFANGLKRTEMFFISVESFVVLITKLTWRSDPFWLTVTVLNPMIE